MERKLILFDYDGVLVDSLSCNLSVVKDVCEKLGYSVFPDVEYCRKAKCISFEQWARHIEMSEILIPQFLACILKALKESAKTLETFPKVVETLKSLADHHCLGIITSNSSVAAKEFATHHNVLECFIEYLGADQAGSKSEKILGSMKKLSFLPCNTYYVGDAGTDVEQGREAGVKTIAVTWGFQGRERLQEANPDFIIDSPIELLRIGSPETFNPANPGR